MSSVVAVFVVLLIYFFPVLNAFSRKHENTVAIGVLNLFTGWTFIGWVIALVWSYKK